MTRKQGNRFGRRAESSARGNVGRNSTLASVGAAIALAAIHDLRKPDSVIRNLVGAISRKLLVGRTSRTNQTIDSTDSAEVVIDNGTTLRQQPTPHSVDGKETE